MATPTTIGAFISAAVLQGITMAQLLEVLKYSIIAGVSDDGRTVNMIGSDGTTMAVLPWDAAVAALTNLKKLAMAEAGPVHSVADFSPYGSGQYGSL